MAITEEVERQGVLPSANINNADIEKGDGAGETAPSALTWDSPEDAANPRNWSFGKRVFHTAVPALYGFVITLATSVYVPALFLVAADFKVGREAAELPLSLYTLGLGIGPLIAAPLSELFGRRIIYWGSMPLLLAFTAGAGAAQNIETLIICRFLAGVLGSGAVAIGAGTITDVWDTQKDGGPASLMFVLGPFLGPGLGPLTGAYIINEYHKDWRYSMWVVLMVGGPIFIMALFMNETAWVQILETRARSRGIRTKPLVTTASVMQILRITFSRPIHMMFTEPLVFYLSIYTGFAFAMMFSFFGSFSYVFKVVYHFNNRGVGLTFLGITVGFLLAAITFGIMEKTLFAKAKVLSKGRVAPEHRLYAAMLGSILLPIDLFWWAWTPSKDTHWIVPVIAGVPFGWGTLAIFLSSTVYLVDVYQAGASASAIAANGILRYVLGAAFPLFTLQMYESKLGIHWSGSIFAFVSVVMLPVPWVFFNYGKVLPARSSYDTSAF